MEHQKHIPPLTVLGIPLKAILVFLVFAGSLLLVLDPFEIKQSFTNKTSPAKQKSAPNSPSSSSTGVEITATPEIISEAIKNVKAERIKNYELSQDAISTTVLYYVIELTNGGSIEASSISIKPDQVTITTLNGIETVVPTIDIKNILRLKLPEKPSEKRRQP